MLIFFDAFFGDKWYKEEKTVLTLILWIFSMVNLSSAKFFPETQCQYVYFPTFPKMFIRKHDVIVFKLLIIGILYFFNTRKKVISFTSKLFEHFVWTFCLMPWDLTFTWCQIWYCFFFAFLSFFNIYSDFTGFLRLVFTYQWIQEIIVQTKT